MTERLREIEQRCEKATPGPWEIHDSCSWRRIGTPGKDGNILCPTNHPVDHHVDLICDEYDLQFIAHAREDIPYLLGVIKEQAEEIERLQEKDIQSAETICESLSAHARWRESYGI